MKWISAYAHPSRMTFAIKPVKFSDGLTGYCVYAYDGSGKNTHDYLQDTLEIAKSCALEEFGVPVDSWTQVKE